MYQVRIFNQVKRLSVDHEVDCMFLYTKPNQVPENIRILGPYCKNLIPHKTFSQGLLFRALKKFVLKRIFTWLVYPLDFFSLSNQWTAKSIAKRIKKDNYDIVIAHYWQASGFLKYLPADVLKCIDTHYLVEENLDLFHQGRYDHFKNMFTGKLLEKELILQNSCFNIAGLLIVNSRKQKEILDKQGTYKSICIPNGQDLEHWVTYPVDKGNNEKNILFYGALANQFNQKAIKRILDFIWPGILAEHPDARLVIMGSSPPDWLINFSKTDTSIKVTGFVEDVREVFSRSIFALIPLESGSGFRGRAVELMASGVPVIGTRNALQSIHIEHEVNGIFAETDEEIIQWANNLIENKKLRDQLSGAGRVTVKNSFSLDATFGCLSRHFQKNMIHE